MVVLGSSLFATFSLVIACLVRSRERFMGIGQLLTMPLFFASSAIYPVDLMPDWLRVVAMLNPLTYMVDALRALMVSGAIKPTGRGCRRCRPRAGARRARGHRRAALPAPGAVAAAVRAGGTRVIGRALDGVRPMAGPQWLVCRRPSVRMPLWRSVAPAHRMTVNATSATKVSSVRFAIVASAAAVATSPRADETSR